MGLAALSHAQRERILLLDQCLTWKGQVNRRDLTQRFDISTAQAAVDFRTYLSLTQTPPTYDATAKSYFASEDHRGLSDTGPEQVFDLLCAETSAAATGIPLPNRVMDAAIVARLCRAMRGGRDIQITYTSMRSGLSEPRWISPVLFHFDGEAIHLRAWSHKHQAYRDYLPIRMSKQDPLAFREWGARLPFDSDWHRFVRLWIGPRPGLTEAQARVVRLEYGFQDQEHITFEIRRALVFYAVRRWRLGQPEARIALERTEDMAGETGL